MSKARQCHQCGRDEEKPGRKPIRLRKVGTRSYPKEHDLLACDDCYAVAKRSRK